MTTYLITGGSGSFGQAYTRVLLDRGVTVRVLARREADLDHMEESFDHPNLRCLMGDVRDEKRLILACRGVDVVIHAAAAKRIPRGERDPFEFVQTNIIGTENLIRACQATTVTRLVALSSDKACSPLNLYGATKLTMEKMVCAANGYVGPGTLRLACTRYGNVAGSKGSVIPVWRSLIERGYPVGITDTRMTRFWCTMNEACELVDIALVSMQGGEVFVPKIPSFYITDLAEAMGAESKFTGIRPGEKLHEEMINNSERRRAVDQGTHYVLLPDDRAYGDGLPVAYASNTNPDFMGVPRIAERLNET